MIEIAAIGTAPLDVARHLDAVNRPWVGAVASFIGTVRSDDPEARSPVVALAYSAHPDAEQALRAIVEEAAADAVVAVSHRVGRLEVGEVAVVIAVGTAHRDEAFRICRALIEEIKRALPIWKKQFSSDGEAVWKGIGG